MRPRNDDLDAFDERIACSARGVLGHAADAERPAWALTK